MFSPPKLAKFLLKLLSSQDKDDAYSGDIEEIFSEQVNHLGLRNARKRYWWEVLHAIPRFIKEKGNGLKICLLNLDLDLYKPTKIALEHFIPHMVKGGVVIIDEYALETFGGETKAVDDYFKKMMGSLPSIKKFSWHTNPSGYMIIE